MAHEPKKRHSRARQGKRRASISLTVVHSVICKNCGGLHPSHAICQNCGFYKGQQVVQKNGSKTVQTSA
ncbi:MAG: 50S ribosomal protein L32 [Patescibacteria group bacterium]